MIPVRPTAYSYIRMSTDAQLKGDSRRRQMAQSAEYARTHDLELLEGSQLEDIGVSAFKGANVRDGALGGFLRAIKDRKVVQGSYLLVESLDRLSRQEVLRSLSLFVEIINAGVNIVTLTDNRVYTREKVDVPDLIISLTIMSRAHEESRTKSQRVRAAWANKRANANTKPLTKWCPAWLKLSADRSRYEVNPGRAAVVRAIFEDTASGLGNFAITRRLNLNGVPTFGVSHGWHNSYIAKIIANRAVLGEFQPSITGPDGKRTPVGEPISNYFPRIIEDDLFYRAQAGRAERRVSGKGRKGQYLTNIFSGLAFCAYCNGRMRLDRKGPKSGTYLVCEPARRGMDCISTGWAYSDFEKSFLAFVQQLELPSLMQKEDSKSKQLDEELRSLEGRQVAIREEMETAYGLLGINKDLKFVADKLAGLQEQLSIVEQGIEDKSKEKQSLTSEETSYSQSRDEIGALIVTIQAPSEHIDLYKLRSQIADRIKSLVLRLQIAPAGRRQAKSSSADVFDKALNSVMLPMRDDQRFFMITFKTGDVLVVSPARDDPLQVDVRVLGNRISGQIVGLYGSPIT